MISAENAKDRTEVAKRHRHKREEKEISDEIMLACTAGASSIMVYSISREVREKLTLLGYKLTGPGGDRLYWTISW